MIRFLVFVSGAILMSLEILGSRVLAPSYGNSIFVWGSLIGVFMAALSLGYWIGGVLADRNPRPAGLISLLLMSGALITIIPLLQKPVFLLAGHGTRSGPLLASMGLFFLPTVLMGAVSPYAIRLQQVTQAGIGKTAGGLYAISTMGSIVGTIGTAFWLVPLAGVVTLIHLLGAILLMLSSVLLLRNESRKRAVVLMIASVAASGYFLSRAIAESSRLGVDYDNRGRKMRVLHRGDSLYHHILISEGYGQRYLRFDNSWQSAMDLKDVHGAGLAYTNYLQLAFAFRPDIRNVLVIGLGGGTTAKQILRERPAVRVDAVEIDPEVVDLAYRFFAVPRHPRLRVFTEDGRRYLERTGDKYDLVIIDTFYVDAIPFHLTTLELMQVVRDHLRPGGLLAANIIGSLDGEETPLFTSVYKTVGGVFPERYVFARDWAEARSRSGIRNVILFAGMGAQRDPAWVRAAVAKASREGMKQDYARRVEDLVNVPMDLRWASTLTDDFAPVDDMLALY